MISRADVLSGLRVIERTDLADGMILRLDGDVLDTGDLLLVGMRPLTDLEFAREEGRYLVRRGMADVLAWLGETVGPAPQKSGRGRAFLDRLYDTTLN